MGILSGLFGGGGEKADDGGRGDQIKRIDALDLPDEEKMRLILESPELVGLLEAQGIDPSKVGEISLDPRLRDNQMKALESLSQQADEGLTATDKYQMEQLLGDVASQRMSAQSGIEADMARRGMDSSGAAERAKRENVQSSANNARDKAMQMAAMGQQNKMAALSQLGAQSGQMNQADFNRQAQTASAQDAIARANAMNRQQVSGQNLQARQAIENQRAATANAQQEHNKGLEQRQFDNEAKKLGLYNGSMGKETAAVADKTGSQLGALAGGIMGASGGPAGIGAGASAGSAIGSALFEDGGVVTNESLGDSLPIQYRQTQMDAEFREKETKQHEGFKKKYMKRVQDEVMGSSPKPKTPAEPQGKTGHEGTHAEDGAYMSNGSGEIVDSGMESYAGDRVDAKLNDKEIVVNVPQQQRLMDLIRGEISVDELGTDDIVEGVPREFRDDMHEELEEESKGVSKMEGIQELLAMLGK